MGRAGGGSRSSSSRSSSSHRSSSSSRSSSGHRSSSSSSRRAGSSSSYRSSSRSSYGSSSSSFGSSFGRSFGSSLGTGLGRNITGSYGSHRNRPYPDSYYDEYHSRREHRSKSYLILYLAFAAVIFAFCILPVMQVYLVGITGLFGGDGIPTSTIARTKIENVPIYDYDVVKDEINYVDEEFTVGAGLKTFYDKTGVQPYIYFKAYDESLVTDADKDTWAENYFDEQGFSENSMSFIYFEEKNPDDVGYMSVVPGYDTVTVLDSEALNIFWSYWDYYWYGNDTTEDVIINAFTKTGNAIMKVNETQKTATMKVVKVVVVLGIVIVLFVIVTVVIKGKQKKRQQEIEQTKASAEILKQPLERMTTLDSEMEDEYK